MYAIYIGNQKFGTSIVKDLRGRRMYRNKSVRITTLKDKTIYGATQLMKYGRMSAKHIMFQVGSNELENKETDDIIVHLLYLDVCHLHRKSKISTDHTL
jgi:hypothetical protein